MAYIVKKKLKGKIYYYLIKKGWIDGKSCTVSQKYLGSAEAIEKRFESVVDGTVLPKPDFSTVYSFGGVVALYDIVERNGFRAIIEEHSGKRNQGLSVADYIVLAAINRAVAPTSKKSFFKWFDKTVLAQQFPKANKISLSSQGFWNNMGHLDDTKIKSIEDDISRIIVKNYNIPTDCLLFDNTNFFTYIDSANPALLPQRGHCKQKRTDLKIIGLSLMVSPEFNIPLFHETYPGNDNDAKQFTNVIKSLKKRYNALGLGSFKPTLVFDKGNNSEENISMLSSAEMCKFNFVGSLKLNQCPELKLIPTTKFSPLLEDNFGNTIVYRTKKEIYKQQVTLVLTYNPELYKAQIRGIANNIRKCIKNLAEIKNTLLLRALGKITKGKKPSIESVTKKVKDILSVEYMNSIFDYQINNDTENKSITLSYALNVEKFLTLKKESLGKNILFTDQQDWSNEKIVAAYRAQYHVEASFRQMKDIKFLSFRPIRHFTDNNIRVHAFYCVLAFTLCGLLNLEFATLGHKLSINSMLNELEDVEQVISYYKNNDKHTQATSFSRLSGVAQNYIEKYELTKYELK